MTHEESEAALRLIRWPETDGKPVCPACGFHDCYQFRTRHLFKCKGCGKQFSLTSGTGLSYRKMPLASYVAALVFLRGSDGSPKVTEMARAIGCDWRTAHRLFSLLDDRNQ